MKRKATSTTGKKTRKVPWLDDPFYTQSPIPWAPPDHPIYKRGFFVGIVRSTPSPKSAPAPASPAMKPSSAPAPEPSSNPVERVGSEEEPVMPRQEQDDPPGTEHYNVEFASGVLLGRVTARYFEGLEPEEIEWLWMVEARRRATPEEIKQLCAGKRGA